MIRSDSALFELDGILDQEDVLWHIGSIDEANDLLRSKHYLGPLYSGGRLIVLGKRDQRIVAAMLWKHPTAKALPVATWLELARWCLTPQAGPNAGSRMHRHAVTLVRERLSDVTTLVSYSDPGQGHTGALYRACNWQWAPTWQRLRPPPSGNGDWGTGRQEIKDRWIFPIRPDAHRDDVLRIGDASAVRYWRSRATPTELGWAKLSPVREELLA